MTESQRHILSLAIDGSALRRIAEQHWTTGQGIREQAFLAIVGSWVVRSELCIDVPAGTASLEDAMTDFSAAGIPCHGEFGLLSAELPLLSFRVRVPGDGTVAVIAGRSSVRVRLSPDGLVRMVRFAEAVLPEVEEMVLREEDEYDKAERAGLIASAGLRPLLERCGRPFKIVRQDGDRLSVHILLSPAGKLSVTVPAERAVEFAATLDETLRCAELLYSRFGASVRVSDLDFWDRWAGRAARKGSRSSRWGGTPGASGNSTSTCGNSNDPRETEYKYAKGKRNEKNEQRQELLRGERHASRTGGQPGHHLPEGRLGGARRRHHP